MVCTTLPICTSGICSIAPADVFATVALIGALCRLGMSTAVAPAHSAVRIIAPILCGSSTPSVKMSKGTSCVVSCNTSPNSLN